MNNYGFTQRLVQPFVFGTSRILAYHSVHPNRRDFIAVTPNAFYEQMQWLASNGWQGLSLSEFLQNPHGKTFAITFDDGYADNLEYAVPILHEFQFTATIFVVVNRINSDVVHNKNWLKSYPTVPSIAYRYLTWTEIDLVLKQNIEIGSHTLHHFFLDQLDIATQKQEIINSRIKLEENLAIPVTTFCYPAGRYTLDTIRIVQEAGYSAAVVTPQKIPVTYHSRALSRYTLRRVGIYNTDTLLRFMIKCTPMFDAIRLIRNLQQSQSR